MGEWWAAIGTLEKVFFCIAAPATAVLLIQTISLIFGFGEQDALGSDVSGIEGLDADGLDAIDAADGLDDAGAADASLDGGLRLFSIRGIIAFFTCLGWGGLAALELAASNAPALIIALVLGTAALVLMAKMISAFMKLQESGNDDLRHAIGRSGEVYLTIPPNGEGMGKVSLDLGSGIREFGAVSYSDKRIPTGAQVRVTDLARDGVLVVEYE